MKRVKNKQIIPGSKKRFLEAKPGDQIKVWIPAEEHNSWMYFEGRINGKETFLEQCPQNPTLIIERASELKYIQFYEEKGATLDRLCSSCVPIESTMETYADKKDKLISANLWEEER